MAILGKLKLVGVDESQWRFGNKEGQVCHTLTFIDAGQNELFCGCFFKMNVEPSTDYVNGKEYNIALSSLRGGKNGSVFINGNLEPVS
jgi:hypothetical protein